MYVLCRIIQSVQICTIPQNGLSHFLHVPDYPLNFGVGLSEFFFFNGKNIRNLELGDLVQRDRETRTHSSKINMIARYVVELRKTCPTTVKYDSNIVSSVVKSHQLPSENMNFMYFVFLHTNG